MYHYDIIIVFGLIISGVPNELNLSGGSGHPGHLLFAPQSRKYRQHRNCEDFIKLNK